LLHCRTLPVLGPAELAWGPRLWLC
jgi:hypothetical protein